MFKSLFEIENFETSVAVQRHSRAKLYTPCFDKLCSPGGTDLVELPMIYISAN